MISGRSTRGLVAVGLFGLLVMIALFVRDDFIRPLGGDVLVVVFLYFALRAVTGWHRRISAVLVLLFAIIIEISQGLGLVSVLGLEDNRLASTILGATFDLKDIAAYAIGVTLAYLLDRP